MLQPALDSTAAEPLNQRECSLLKLSIGLGREQRQLPLGMLHSCDSIRWDNNAQLDKSFDERGAQVRHSSVALLSRC